MHGSIRPPPPLTSWYCNAARRVQDISFVRGSSLSSCDNPPPFSPQSSGDIRNRTSRPIILLFFFPHLIISPSSAIPPEKRNLRILVTGPSPPSFFSSQTGQLERRLRSVGTDSAESRRVSSCGSFTTFRCRNAHAGAALLTAEKLSGRRRRSPRTGQGCSTGPLTVCNRSVSTP
ncbi:hypothetical protein LZ31DRAFT_209488 [Colletotrichum somersetense]|nr:hypothetical protein LZ31DRAFT_209488 [Colletotrichum somersetense]